MSRTSTGDSFARHVSSAVRGSAALREDIADEIADHLASHVKEHPAEAADDAIRAFGDPKAVARELRRVHLGGQIMLQRIMVAVLVVIVLALGANVWFSWRTAHEQSQQFAEMNERLGSLVALQRAGQPEPPAYEFHAFFFTGPPDEPAKHYEVSLLPLSGGDDGPPRETLIADADGKVNLTNQMTPGMNYELSGRLVPSEAESGMGSGQWSRVIRFPGPDEPKELRINVGPRHEYTVQIVPSTDVTWDRDRMHRVEIVFDQASGRNFFYGDGRSRRPVREQSSHSRTYDLELGKATRISGLLPGMTRASARFIIDSNDITIRPLPPLPIEGSPGRPARPPASPAAGQDDPQAVGISRDIVGLDIPEGGGQIAVEIPPFEQGQVTGIIFDGTPDKPVAGAGMSLVRWSDGETMPQYLEFLRTDEHGSFAALSRPGNDQVVVFDWKNKEGQTVRVHWPLDEAFTDRYVIADVGARFQLDVARLGEVHFGVTGLEDLSQGNRRLICPLRIGPVSRLTEGPRDRRSTKADCWNRELDPADASGVRLTIPAGKYGMTVDLLLAEWTDTVPGLEQRHLCQRGFSFEVQAGQATEVAVPVGALDEWMRRGSEWHERGKNMPSTMPVAQAAAAE